MVSTTFSLPRAYLVLGSTGFLGPNIVLALLTIRPYIKICCLNRSADGEQRTVSALLSMGCDYDAISSRLEFVVADMSKASLGLGQLAEQLASEVEEVIFNAWNSNWALPFQRFRPLLEALQSAIHFCAHEAKQARIIFISSICAIGNWPRIHPQLPLIPESVAHDSRYAMAHGYGESKAAAERMLAQASNKEGLSVVIMRAGQVGGPSPGRSGKWPVQGWLHSIIKNSRAVGSFPAHVQSLDWLPVDALATSIANVVQRLPRDRAVKTFNMVHPQPAPWNTLICALEELHGQGLSPIALPIWLDKLPPRKFKLHAFLKATDGGREDDMAFCVENARTVLPEVAPITKDLLISWLQGWSHQGDDLKARL